MIEQPITPQPSDSRWSSNWKYISFFLNGHRHEWRRGHFWQKYILTDEGISVLHMSKPKDGRAADYETQGFYFRDIRRLKIDGSLQAIRKAGVDITQPDVEADPENMIADKEFIDGMFTDLRSMH